MGWFEHCEGRQTWRCEDGEEWADVAPQAMVEFPPMQLLRATAGSLAMQWCR